MRILWITNLQAPYREPVWAHMASRADLRVEFLASAVEDRPWVWRASPAYSSAVADTVRIPGLPSERALYIYRRGLNSSVRDADVVIVGSWESPAYLQALSAARRADKATVLYYESIADSQRYRSRHPVSLVRSAIVRSVDTLFTGGIASTRAVESMGVDPARIVTGFNTVDVASFHRKALEIRATSRPRTESGHVYLFVGRLLARKNVSTLIRAFGMCAKPGDELQIVGTGPEERQLRELAHSRTGPGSTITFLGDESGERLHERYALADTLVLPSLSEVWGMVVNESLAAGLHAVVSTGAGVAESVRSMPGVYLASPDVEGLVCAMRASRDDWRGPLLHPPILCHTPEDSGDHALEACRRALEVRAHQIPTLRAGQGGRRLRDSAPAPAPPDTPMSLRRTTKAHPVPGPCNVPQARTAVAEGASTLNLVGREVRLNLGSGGRASPGWVCIDRSPNLWLSRFPRLKLLLRSAGVLDEAHMSAWDRAVQRGDIKRLRFSDGSVDAIYSSHTLEHLYFEEARQVLSESARVLRPGGTIRLALPDAVALAEELAAHRDDAAAGRAFNQALLAHSERPPSRTRRLVSRAGGHVHRWQPTAALVTEMLTDAGFTDVHQCGYREGSLPDLVNIETRPESFFLEARRP